MSPILKKKLEFAVGVLCLYLVYVFAVKITAEPEINREPITTINVTQHIDAFENGGAEFNKAAMESMAEVEAQNMVKTGDIESYEDQLRKSGMLNW